MQSDHWFTTFQALAQRHADQPALVAEGLDTPLSFSDLFTLSAHLAAQLQRQGLQAGMPVRVCLPNTAWAPLVQIALAMLGTCDLPVAHSATDAELDWIGEQAGTHWLITDRPEAGHSHGLAHAHARYAKQRIHPGQLAGFEHGLHAALMQARNTPETPLFAIDGITMGDIARLDIARLPGRALPSSGTTGLPKISVYTQQARHLAHRLQCELLPVQPAPGEHMLLLTPFSHGASLLAWAWWSAGGCVNLRPGLETGYVLRALENGLGALFAPPTVLYKLLEARHPDQVCRVRVLFCGTQRLDADLYRRTRAVFGPVVRITYGKSECINPICYSQPETTDAAFLAHPDAQASCVGYPAPGVELRVVDDAAAEPAAPLPTGVPGTVWLRADHMSQGLWEHGRLRPWPEGWHDTSDRGYLDDAGRLWLLGRKGDAIKTGGYLVQLDAVEAIARAAWPHLDCCALAWPSAHWGAVVVLAWAASESSKASKASEASEASVDLSPTAVQQAYAGHAKPLWPRATVQVDRLIRNAQGKLQRTAQLQVLMQHHVLQDGAYPSLVSVQEGGR